MTDLADPQRVSRTRRATVQEASEFEEFRRPTPDGPGLERELANANRRAAEASRQTLDLALPMWRRIRDARWAGPVEVWQGDVGFLEDLPVEDLFDEIMLDEHVPPERVLAWIGSKAVQSGDLGDDELEFEILRPPSRNIAAAIASGGGVLVSQADQHRSDLVRTFEHIERVFRVGAHLDLGIIGGPDGVVLEPASVVHLVAATSSDLVIELTTDPSSGLPVPDRDPVEMTLAAGRAAIISPGWRCRISASSRGVTPAAVLCIPRLTWQELSELLVGDLIRWPPFRGYTPFDPARSHESYDGSIYERGVGAAVTSVMGQTAVRRILSMHEAMLPGRWTAGLESTLALVARGEPRHIRCPLPGGLHLAPGGTDGVMIVGGGRKVQVSDHGGRALALVADGGIHPVEALTSCAPIGASSRWAIEMAADLICCGLVEVVDEGDAR